jgi:hypothetical protein
MMALGSARTLQPTDMWKMDDERSARNLAGRLMANYERRTQEAIIHNERLLNPATPLPRSKRILYSILPNRERREHDYRTKWGKKRASLKWSLNDTFGSYFWWGCLFKLFGDTATACTPLLIRAIIKWSTEWQIARDTGTPKPSEGRAVGMAIGLLAMLLVSSVGLHHFFIRSTGTGVYLRAAIISSVYDRSLRLTQKSRGELPNGKLVNHISTDTSRIDFAAGFYGILYTAREYPAALARPGLTSSNPIPGHYNHSNCTAQILCTSWYRFLARRYSRSSYHHEEAIHAPKAEYDLDR